MSNKNFENEPSRINFDDYVQRGNFPDTLPKKPGDSSGRGDQMLVKDVNMLMINKGLAEDGSDKDRSLKSVASSIVTEEIVKSNIHLKSVQIERSLLQKILLFLFLLSAVVAGILRQVIDSSFTIYLSELANDLGKDKLLSASSFLFKDSLKLDLIKKGLV